MTKIIYPKCPFCKTQYNDSQGLHTSYDLLNLATKGYCKEAIVKCRSCGKDFRVRCNVTYFASKI